MVLPYANLRQNEHTTGHKSVISAKKSWIPDWIRRHKITKFYQYEGLGP